ncbi:MAG: ABC transporter substrate-binding protein [Clostridia bacterium]|nr:ABC transporter substrate-binding protein [Clostridia bacterium]
MKKFSLFLVALLLTFSFAITGCGKKDNVIRVNEVTHSIFYAPLYVAINKGYFKEEGLTIELTNGGGSDKSMTALVSGAADVILAGPETSVYVAAQGKKDQPMIFGQLTRCDGSFIIGRENIENFTLNDLSGKEIIGGRPGGMPAMTLEHVVRQAGVQNVTFNTTIDFNNTTAAFLGGTADFVTAFEPLASDIVAQGKGYILASVGEIAGSVPYTAFMTTSSYLSKNSDKLESFLRAIQKAYDFMTSSTTTVDDVVEALYPSFNTSSKASIKAAVISYTRINAWNQTPVMTEQSFNNLIEILTESGTLTTTVEFNKIVDNTIANKIAK